MRIFWLDEAEPEYSIYDFDNYRYHLGPNVQIGNLIPVLYAKTFFDGMQAAGLNMGIAGITWWTTDIGGFHGGNPDDPQFREIFARWFEYGTLYQRPDAAGTRKRNTADAPAFL